MSDRSGVLMFALAALLVASTARAIEVSPVTIDLEPGTASASPRRLSLGTRGAGGPDVLYFRADVGGVTQVRATDGTPSGTSLVADASGNNSLIVPTPWGSLLFKGPWPGEGYEILEGTPGEPPRLRYALVPGPGDTAGFSVARVPFHGHIVIRTQAGQAIALGAGTAQVDLGAMGPEFSSDSSMLAARTPTGVSYQLRRSLSGDWTVLPQEPPVANSAFQMITAFGDRACGKIHAGGSGGSLYCADLATGQMRRMTDATGYAPGLRDFTPYLRMGDNVVFMGADLRLWESDGTMNGLHARSAEGDLLCIGAGGGSRVVESTDNGATRWRDVATGASGPLPNTLRPCDRPGDSSGFVADSGSVRWHNITAVTGGGKLALFDGTEVSEVTAPGISWSDERPAFVGNYLVVIGSDATYGTELRVIDMRLFDDGFED